jgi:hypothetical protein
MTIQLVFLILALVCFLCSAANMPQSRVNLTALGLAFYILSLIIPP